MEDNDNRGWWLCDKTNKGISSHGTHNTCLTANEKKMDNMVLVGRWDDDDNLSTWHFNTEIFFVSLALCEWNPPVLTVHIFHRIVELWCVLRCYQNKLLNTQLNCQWFAMPLHSYDITVIRGRIVVKVLLELSSPHRCLSGKLWYLQHNCVGDTIVYH